MRSLTFVAATNDQSIYIRVTIFFLNKQTGYRDEIVRNNIQYNQIVALQLL